MLLGNARGFNAPPSSQTTFIYTDAVAEDINGDGVKDLIAAGFNGIATFIGRGLGEFNAPTNYDQNVNPASLLARDFNLDGKVDIAALNPGSSNVTILINNGNGEYPMSVRIGTGELPQTYGVGDFNNDGRLDVIVKNGSGALTLFTGGDNLMFTAGATSIGMQLNPDVFAVGDFNGDGNLDLAMSASPPIGCAGAGSEIVILVGNGQGAFTPADRLPIPEMASFIGASDFNGDGRSDLIIKIACGSQLNSAVTILSDQGGGFSRPVEYAVGAEPRTFVVGDLNGDTRPDIAVTLGTDPLRRETIVLLINNGNGLFNAIAEIPTGGSPGGVAIGDINSDGAADLTVFRNQMFSGSLFTLFKISRCFTPTSAASFAGPLATDSIAAGFGSGLSTTTDFASTIPLPISLGGASVMIKDSAGVERYAPLFFVSPTQINHLIPPDAAPGPASVKVMNGPDVFAAGSSMITPIAPGLFSVDSSGQGLAAAVVLRVRPDNSQVYEPVFRFDSARNRFVAVPIDLSDASDQVFLILFGTGIRNFSAAGNVSVKFGGDDSLVQFAGSQGGFPGLDQVNARLSQSLAGRGNVDVVVAVDGKTSNTLIINIK